MSVGEQIDTRSAAGRLVLNVLASVAQWEREAIGERTAAAMAHKKTKGERLGGCPTATAWPTTAAPSCLCTAEQAVIVQARELRRPA